MTTTSLRVTPLWTYLLRRRLGVESWVVWTGLALVVVYVRFISPQFTEQPDARLMLFNPLPWALFPFLFADTDFDRHGWVRVLLTPRSSAVRPFLAHMIARAMHAILHAGVITLILVAALAEPMDPAGIARLLAGLAGFALYMAALGTAIGRLVRGRGAILTTYVAILVLAYLTAKLPSDASTLSTFVLFPAPLTGLQTIDLWIADDPWHVVSGFSASIVWWLMAVRLFLWRT